MQYFTILASTLCLVGVLWACNTHVSEPVSLEHKDSDLFVRLEMNHRAVLLSTIAPYDTLQLRTIPFGDKDSIWKPVGFSQEEIDSIIKANPPIFISRDSSRIRVTKDGLMRAVKATTNTGTVQIIATQQINNITKACTTLVRALPVANPLPAKRMVISSVDSLKVAAASSAPLIVQVFDENNNIISNVVTYARTLNFNIIGIGAFGQAWNITSILGNGGRPPGGSAKIQVVATVFGKEVGDEIQIRSGYPLSGGSGGLALALRNGNRLHDITIAKGGIVSWLNDTIAGIPDVAIDLIFDDPSAVSAAPLSAQNSGSGNIHWPLGDRAQTEEQRTRYRQFNTPGIYPYRVSSRTNGRVIVKEF